MYLPDLMKCEDGSPVLSPAQWERRRKELLHVLETEQYGIQPRYHGKTRGEITDVLTPCCAGHAQLEKIQITFETPGGPFSFPLLFFCPSDHQPHPLILFINFRPDAYDPYFPAEEIIDHGFALAVFCYTDITSDDGNMKKGLAGLYARSHPETDWGKLSMWAFGASRALDYLLTRQEVDRRSVAVAGHSRLGKAALLCGALDERVRFTFANCSGCGGDALEQTKHPGAEDYAFMAHTFPYWFCGNRNQYIDPAVPRPYDQHFLLAAIAPRYVAVGSAQEDTWADPFSAQLCCAAASPAWTIHGLPGFVGPQAPAQVNTAYGDGCIGYHLRDGVHFFSRQDWLRYMAFAKKHMAE